VTFQRTVHRSAAAFWNAPLPPEHDPPVNGEIVNASERTVNTEPASATEQALGGTGRWPVVSGGSPETFFSWSERDCGGVMAWSCRAARGDAGGPPASTGEPPVPPRTQARGETFSQFRAEKVAGHAQAAAAPWECTPQLDPAPCHLRPSFQSAAAAAHSKTQATRFAIPAAKQLFPRSL